MCAEHEDGSPTSEYVLVGHVVAGESDICQTGLYPNSDVAHAALQNGQDSIGQIANEAVAIANTTVPHKIRPGSLLAKIGLPCQTQAEYDYGHCYSFYANGCYNTCQFVETGDIEDFMNNEKRKEKSRDAARSRRSRETQIFADLGKALPIASDQVSQLDKASVMRLAISYLRVRDMINLVPLLPVKDKVPSILKEESIFMKALEGFLLVISSEGDFVYLSENVSDYLGVTQVDLMGQNVYEYSHPCDHEEIRDILSSKAQDKSDALNSFFIRLKCTLTSKGRSVNLKSATFKVIHCTGHVIKPQSTDDENKGYISSCLVAIGQPIPHPSNIDTPLPRQTFLTKHSLDMKFTHADDEFMMDVLGYTPDDLIGKSVYEYHHAMDNDSVGSAFKCLFSKGQCDTNLYRFLAKTGGYVWVVTQATLIYDKMQKPQSVVCVNFVISGVECKDEIYAAHQLACVKAEKSATPEPLASVPKVLTPPKVHVELVDDHSVSQSVDIDISDPASPVDTALSPKPRPVSITAKLLISSPKETQEEAARPHTTTETIFAPRTKDMSRGFLTYSEKEPGLTMKDEPDDLTHLAPTAGDVCVSLEGHPFLTDDMLDDILLKEHSFGPLLTDEPSDPFISYRDYRDSSPQLLSPNLSKNSDCSLPSLCSPNSSLLDEDQMSTFMNLQMEDDSDLTLKAPFIPNFSDDLPLLMATDIMWNNNDRNNGHDRIPENSSTLAQMLGSSVNKRTLKGTDRGGGTVEETNVDVFNDQTSNRSWSRKLSPKMEVDSVGQMDRSPSLKRSNNSSYDQQRKRLKNEPKEKMSSELLHQLMSNNQQRGRPKNKGHWLLDTGGKAACISQPSDSVLKNLLGHQKGVVTGSPPSPMTSKKHKTQLTFTTRKRMLQHQEKDRQQEESRKNWIRKNSLSLLDPEAISVPSLLDLTQQDCEVNAPVNSSLLQGEELLIALDIAQGI